MKKVTIFLVLIVNIISCEPIQNNENESNPGKLIDLKTI